MTIETTNEAILAEKRKAGMAKAREAKAAKKQAAVEPPSRLMEKDEVRAKRARLLQELADLPSEAPIPTNAIPGTFIKDGLGDDKVPWTPPRLRQACDNNETVNGYTFRWVSVIGDPAFSTLSWQGIVYWFFAGIENKIPSTHYDVYRQALEDRRREAARWAQPTNSPVFDGYMSPPHQFSTSGPLEPREG